MSDKHGNPFAPYELQFDIQERKAIVAEMIRELRKAKGYQQKEIAQMLGISAQTYNGYEKGRNEPPIEVLVRISYLYDLPMDMLVQRDRLHKQNESALISITKMEEEIAKAKQEFKSSEYAENKQLNDLMSMMEQMTDVLKTVASKTKP
jgi:transcriptional regulator with XRE-family HTH domain